MKKVLLFAILLATLNSACKKSTSTTTTTAVISGPVLQIPHNMDSIFASPATVAPFPYLRGVYGVFTSCRVTGALVETSGVPYDYHRNWQNAILVDSVNAVSVNGHILGANSHMVGNYIKAYFNSYNDGSWWSTADSNNWNIDGITAPTFTVNVDGAMPEFTGTLPTNITASSDFTYGFNTSNSVGADSAYMILNIGYDFVYSTCVSAHGGVAKISSLVGSSITAPGQLTYIDGKIFGGRALAIVLYSHTYRTVEGKRYVFVKQTITLTTVKLI